MPRAVYLRHTNHVQTNTALINCVVGGGDSGRKEKVMGKNTKDGDYFVHRQHVDTFLYPHLLRNSELFRATSVEQTEICYSVFY
jgi:hypothetical protein